VKLIGARTPSGSASESPFVATPRRAKARGGGDSFRLDGEGTHWQWPERPKTPGTGLPPAGCFIRSRAACVIHILPRGPDLGHHGPFRVGQFSHPARTGLSGKRDCA